MNIIPFKKIVNIPNGMGGRADIINSNDLIDVMDRFRFQTLRVSNKPYYRGVSGYLFDAQIQIGFGSDYQILDVEFRHPFTSLEGEGIYLRNVNLICPTLLDTHVNLAKAGISSKVTDVGVNAPDVGVSFFSSDFEGDLDVRLDAVTVYLRSST